MGFHSTGREAPSIGSNNRLYNEDLAPAGKRNWGTWQIFAMWMQDIHSISVYTFAASLFFLGLNGYQVFFALIVGILIIWLLMNLPGNAGQRTGVPFPVLARATFGIYGSNVAAMMRGLSAMVYYGVLTYLGSKGIQIAVMRFWPESKTLMNHEFLGMHALGWICFAVMWLIQLLVVRRGLDSIRRFQDWAGPAIWVVMIGVAAYVVIKTGGNISFNISPVEHEGSTAWALWFSAVALIVSNFGTFLVNFADFGRLAPNKRTIRLGNFLGLPINFLAFSVVVVVVTSGSVELYGATITDPIDLVARMDNTMVVLVAAVIFVIATIGINIVADFVSAAYDFANLAPKYLTFKRGGILAGCISVLFLPWELYNNPDAIQLFTAILGAFLGPIFGILMCDYWVRLRGRVDVRSLYDPSPDGRYYYTRGVNWLAVSVLVGATGVSFAVAILPSASYISSYSWVLGAALAGLGYLVSVRIRKAMGSHLFEQELSHDEYSRMGAADESVSDAAGTSGDPMAAYTRKE